MKEDLYILEDRAHHFIFHWLILMIGGLCDIEEKNIKKPIKFHTFSELDIQKETFDLLKPDFVFVQKKEGYNLINNFGATLLTRDLVDDKYYKFLREKILYNNRLENLSSPKRLLYVSRNKSHVLSCNNGVRKRQLLNENEVYEVLKKKNFEYINLENYSFIEKIKLFQDAKMIITPNGGALTFALFANQRTKVIELHDSRTTGEDQYYNTCIKCNISIERYTNISSYNKDNQPTFPGLGVTYNIKLNDIQDFDNFIENKLIAIKT